MKGGAKALRRERMLVTSNCLAEKGSGPEIGEFENYDGEQAAIVDVANKSRVECFFFLQRQRPLWTVVCSPAAFLSRRMQSADRGILPPLKNLVAR